MIRDYVQELVELGAKGTAFRVAWELGARAGLLDDGRAPATTASLAAERIPFASRDEVRRAVGGQVDEPTRDELARRADEACHGRLRCFSRWTADFGEPIDWYANPQTGARWPSDVPWSKALAGSTAAHGDVKLTWEAGRFPQAYDMARASVWAPKGAPRWAAALASQIRDFDQWAPYGRGVHWASSQEVAFRLIAWMFAYRALLEDESDTAVITPLLGHALHLGAAHTARHIAYARYAVHNNHLLSEALLLLLAGTLLPEAETAAEHRRTAIEILEEQSVRQFYADGGYIQQSHNYHRLAVQVLLLAARLLRDDGETSEPLRAALERSVDFLHAHQNPSDGRLPNYGFNDGALPMLLSSCAFSDFRPTLQAANLFARGERLYPTGPWDEEAAWLLGAKALQEAPLVAPTRRSRSFSYSGHHVLRHAAEPTSFAAFRCGTLRDRFSQIDMLHLDIWWLGQNVAADPGSYLYNADERLNAHFMGTASHNTLTVDGQDQMRLHRRWKVLYWTEAELLRRQEQDDAILCVGEHSGYQRLVPGCMHRRSVLFVKPELWIVVDHVTGEGSHDVRLHWQGGAYPHRRQDEAVVLETPRGHFAIATYDETAEPMALTVARGQDDPTEGWLSRHYGHRDPAPSMSVAVEGSLPRTFVSVLGPAGGTLERRGTELVARAGATGCAFEVADGLIASWRVER